MWWKLLDTFELRFLRKEEQQHFTRISRHFPWRAQDNISRQHFCKPCRDDPLVGSHLGTKLRRQRLQSLPWGLSLSEYSSKWFWVWVMGLSEYGSVAYSVDQQVLNVGAWNPQECGSKAAKAPLSCNAAFSKLHCSFSLSAAQLLVKMTSTLQKTECCSATSAVQLSENSICSATSVFASCMLQGWGLGLPELKDQHGKHEPNSHRPTRSTTHAILCWGWSPHLSNLEAHARVKGTVVSSGNLAHRNRSDFCDLRLRCPSRTPEIANDLPDKAKQCYIAI